jgi:hypothetical protein
MLVDPPKDWSIRRQREYFEWADQVIQGLLGVNERLDACVKDVLAQGKSRLPTAEQTPEREPDGEQRETAE